MTLKYVFVLLLSACTATVPTKLVQKVTETEYRIVGKLNKTEYDTIIDIVNHHPNEQINFYVTSIGGTSSDLFEAMDAVHKHGKIHWFSVKQCDSSCAVMALSTGHAHGEFRLHSFYKREGKQIFAAPDFNEKIMCKLHDYGYNRKQLDHMFHSVEHMWPFKLEESVITE